MPLDQLASRLAHPLGAGRPFVTLAYAQSLDGSLTAERGRSFSLSGPEALEVTHRLRAMHDGILAGIGTVMADDPRLDVRLVPGSSPRAIVVDSRLRIPNAATLLGNGRTPWLATTAASATVDRERLDQRGAEILLLPALANGWVDLAALCSSLFERGVRTLMVEGGARIIASFLAARLADHLVVTVSPRLLDGLAAVSRAHPLGPFELPQLGSWQVDRFGNDLVVGAPLSWEA